MEVSREAIEQQQIQQLWKPGVGADKRCYVTDNSYRCRLFRSHNGTPHLFCKTYSEIIADTKKQIAEIEQYFTDVASWNDNSVARLYEGAEAIDPDPGCQMQNILNGLRAMLDRERAIGRLKD